jgi:hypothetical protein
MHKTVFVLLLILLWCPVIALAEVYNVNRSFTDTFAVPPTNATATLTGTVTCPMGFFLIHDQSASPFTNVNLTLTVNGSSYHLVNVDTSGTQGNSHFFINATATDLTFNTAGADAQNNPAGLKFSDSGGNLYGVGSDLFPTFETAFTATGLVNAFPTFPLLFGAAVPEPTSAALVAFAAMIFGIRRSRIRCM